MTTPATKAHSRATEDALRDTKANPYEYGTEPYRAYEARYVTIRAAIDGVGECLGTDEDVITSGRGE